MRTENIGSPLKRLFGTIVKVLTLGTVRLDEAVDNMATAQDTIHQLDEAVEQHSQETLDNIDDALTAWHKLNADAERAKAEVAIWQKNATIAATKAKEQPEGTEERKKLEGLALNAIKRKQDAQTILDAYNKEIEEARPDAEAALKQIEQVGLQRETALAAGKRMEVAAASTDAKLKLANAQRNGSGAEVKNLMNQAEDQITEMKARAKAANDINANLPRDPDAVSAEINELSRNDAAAAELAELMK